MNVLMPSIGAARRVKSLELDRRRRARLGQFLTPTPVATFMARMVECKKPVLRILDPGAGLGSLSAALVAELCLRPTRPEAITLTAYEIDSTLTERLRMTLDLCKTTCRSAGIRFEARVVAQDFLEAGTRTFAGDLFAAGEHERFDCAILNPPYRKIRTDSRERGALSAIGVQTSNLYAGFLAVTARLLVPGGEMIAITPRSFCNGPYFEPFRRFFLQSMRFQRIHVFDARNRAFADDEVLQENVVFRAIKTTECADDVLVSSSLAPNESTLLTRKVKHDHLVRPDDPHLFIHIVPDGDGEAIRDRIRQRDSSLSDLDLTVSTGRVVDFRARDLLRDRPGRNSVPLIYPCHFHDGFVEWPSDSSRKPNALALAPASVDLLIPQGFYVLVRRFSAKEERRRVVAAVYDPERVDAEQVAFENHLNYFHSKGAGLPATLAKGLAAYLNSTTVDRYFRQFSGHTQVNATDLRSLRYPARDVLVALGRRIGKKFPDQEELDRLVDEVAFRG